MSSSVIVPPASARVSAPPAACSVPSRSTAAARPALAAVAGVEVLLAASTSVAADVELRQVAAACAFGAIDTPLEGAVPASVVPVDDVEAVSELGGRLRHVGTVGRADDGLARGWRGLAVVPHGHPLAGVPDGHAAVVIHRVPGPAVLLATTPPWPADVLALITGLTPARASHLDAPPRATPPRAPAHPAWVIRLAFPHALPPRRFVEQLMDAAGLPVGGVVMPPASRPAGRCWARLRPTASADVAGALDRLHRVHRVVGQSWLVL